MTYNGKNVYLFGGSSGIGLETAKQLARQGAHLLLFARNRERLDRAVEEVSRLRLTPHQVFQGRVLDVADHAAVQREVQRAVQDFGIPQVVINMAGRAIPRCFEDISYEQFDETMKINLYGVWNVASAVLPHMKEKGGAFVITSSIAGFLGVFGYADYAASKFALIGLSEVLRAEFKRHRVRVTVLCPPDTNTPGFEAENRTKPPETRMISEGGGLLESSDVARELLDGVRKGAPFIIPGFDGKMTWLMKRHLPAVVDFIMERRIRNATRNA